MAAYCAHAAGQASRPRAYRGGQPLVRRGGARDGTIGGGLARLARGVWPLEQRLSMRCTAGGAGRVGAGVRRDSGRCRFRGGVHGQPRYSRPSARRGRHLHKGRRLVERFFRCISHFRRVATRYDELDCRCREFIASAAAWLWVASLMQQYLEQSWFESARRKEPDFGFHFGVDWAEPVSDRRPLAPVIAACFGLHMFRWRSAGWFTERECNHLALYTSW